MKCKKCGEEMRLMPLVLTSSPPQCVYEYPVCGARRGARAARFESNGKKFAIIEEEGDENG